MRRLCTDSSLICRREICTASGAFDDDSPGSDHTGIPRSRHCGELLAACEESAAIIIIGVTARRVVTRGVMVQKVSSGHSSVSVRMNRPLRTRTVGGVGAGG